MMMKNTSSPLLNAYKQSNKPSHSIESERYHCSIPIHPINDIVIKTVHKVMINPT